MTEQEARECIHGKLNCMNKCGVFEREDSENKNLCDDCDYCYSQGNFGQQKEAFEVAIKALKEIQQYRAIGTVEELKSMKENGAFTGVELAQLAAMQMRLKEYSAIGTIEEFKALKEKAEPKKPPYDNHNRAGYRCPDCNNTNPWGYNYCKHCGQKLDFS